jgi:hypothetical protein
MRNRWRNTLQNFHKSFKTVVKTATKLLKLIFFELNDRLIPIISIAFSDQKKQKYVNGTIKRW